MSTLALSVHNLSKSFGTFLAVRDFSLDIPAGTFVTLLGPSGSGKSTVLRMIAGFEHPDSGEIRMRGHDVLPLPPHRRPVAMVFQRYALFPHLTVWDNVAFGLRRRKLPSQEINQIVVRMLDLVQLAGFSQQYPHQLSGGQAQRVALARALAMQPALLLLDEPLAALDAGLRKQMQSELKHIQRQSGITFLAVTHDQEEALSLSDRVAVMHEGGVWQEGTPQEIFEHPQNRFVAEFMGAENILPVTIRERLPGTTLIDIGGLSIAIPGSFAGDEDVASLVVRPESFRLDLPDVEGWPGRVLDSTYRGHFQILTVAVGKYTDLKVAVPAGTPVPERVSVSFVPEQAVLISD
jgi:spermidine/putrescine transport system ATP-binding protein